MPCDNMKLSKNNLVYINDAMLDSSLEMTGIEPATYGLQSRRSPS